MILASLIVLQSLNPIVDLSPPVYDTLTEKAFHFYAGMQSANRDVNPAAEYGVKYELLLTHPYFMRFGVDYSQARVTDPFAPAGNKKTWMFSADMVAYRGRYGMISYLGAGVVLGLNSFSPDAATMDSVFRELGVNEITLSDKFGYRVFMGIRFEERFVLEMSYQQANPDYIFTRRFANENYSVQRIDGTFSVARMSFGYLLKL